MKTKLLAALTCCFILHCATAQELFKVNNICYKIEPTLNNRISVCNIEGTNSECLNNYTQHKIEIPDSVEYKGKLYPVTRLERYTFANCSNLDSIIISDNVSVLNMYTFENCENLKYIKLPNKVEKINLWCFNNCRNLEELIIPASVKDLTDFIFNGCTKLKNLFLLCEKPKITKNTFSSEFANKEHTIWVLNSYYKQYRTNPTFINFDIQQIDNFSSDRQTILPTTFTNKETRMSLTTDIDKGCDFDIVNGAEYHANKGIEIRKTVDKTRYHFISIPYDCILSDIYSTSGLDINRYGTDWLIMEYDSKGFANGKDINWKKLTDKDTIKAGQGYIIGISNTIDKKYLDANEQIEMVFPIKESITLKHCNGKSSDTPTPLNKVTVNSYPSTDDALKNWNLIGTNLLHTVNNITIDVDNNTINYVSIPNADGKTYKQTETETAGLNNFTSFFVQADKEGIVNIKYNNTKTRKKTDTDKRIVITLSDTNNIVDKTTILLRDDYTNKYEYNKDLLKLKTKDCPQIYTIADNTPLCFAAISNKEIEKFVEIEVTSPNQEEYTIALERNDIRDKDIILIDRIKNTTVNLSAQDYRYVNETTKDNNRFAIYSQQKDTATGLHVTKQDEIIWTATNNRLQIENIKEPSDITLYSISGRIIEIKKGVKDSIIIDKLPKGIYILLITNKKANTYKIEIQ